MILYGISHCDEPSRYRCESATNGRLLDAQALGLDNVDKRISALAMGIQMGATIYDLDMQATL